MDTMNKATLAILAALFASIALADDFKTINGREYKNATLSRVEPDGIVVKFSGGIVKIPFTELSEELRRKYNYDPKAAKAFAADVQQKEADLYSQTERTKREQSERAAQHQSSGYQSKAVELEYDTPEQLTAAVHKAAREKMFSPEEENAELAKISPGGALRVTLDSVTIDTADPKWLTYVIGNSNGDVLERKKGHQNTPSNESKYRWRGFDYVELPAFDDSLRVRVYHELLGNLGDYVIQRNGQVMRER
jgi:hypothetical protein